MKRTGILVLLIYFGIQVYSQNNGRAESVRIMFYNVENLFDTIDDTLREDDEFLPSGVRRWNQSRYKKKLGSIYKTIIAAGDWSPPALVGLCEIENRKVLEDLAYGTYLSNSGYGIIHEESPDERGIDVGLIFRKDMVNVIGYRSLIPSTVRKEDFRTRSVLYAKCEILTDTIHLLINHWPSRRGGVLAGESMRNEIAVMIRSVADSLDRISGGHSKVIIIGDFNCSPEDPVMSIVTVQKDTGETAGTPPPVNLTGTGDLADPGTYRYLGTWEQLDQVIVSDWLLNSPDGLVTGNRHFRIFKPDFLLENDPKYPGMTTFPTYKGYMYRGGFSDHLPVLLDLIPR